MHVPTFLVLFLFSSGLASAAGASVVDSFPGLGSGDFLGVSLALDPQGVPHVAYTDPLTGGLVYGVLVEGSWKLEEASPFGFFPSLKVDASGTAHLAYSSNDGLEYAERSPGGG